MGLLCMYQIIMLLILIVLVRTFWCRTKEIKTFINKSTIITNIFRIQAYNSVIYGYFCIELIDTMLQGKSLTGFTNLFSPNDFRKMMI